MVAVMDIFTRRPHDELQGPNNSAGVMPVTPTSSDCLSSSGNSTCGSVASQPPCPVRRDRTLIFERLENSCRKVGRSKRRRASNEKALAVLVEGYEEDAHLFTRPYRSAFTQLFESHDKMTLWLHFMNMSEEHQEQYLAGAEQRARLLNHSLPCTTTTASYSAGVAARPEAAAARVRDIDRIVTDTRSIHPAALPHDVPPLVRVSESTNGVVSDPTLRSNLLSDHFASPPRPNHLPFAVGATATDMNATSTSSSAGTEALELRYLSSDLDEYFSHSYHSGRVGFSHSTPKKAPEACPMLENSDTLRMATSGERDFKEENRKGAADTLLQRIGDAVYEEANDTGTSASSSFEIIDLEEDDNEP